MLSTKFLSKRQFITQPQILFECSMRPGGGSGQWGPQRGACLLPLQLCPRRELDPAPGRTASRFIFMYQARLASPHILSLSFWLLYVSDVFLHCMVSVPHYYNISVYCNAPIRSFRATKQLCPHPEGAGIFLYYMLSLLLCWSQKSELLQTLRLAAGILLLLPARRINFPGSSIGQVLANT